MDLTNQGTAQKEAPRLGRRERILDASTLGVEQQSPESLDDRRAVTVRLSPQLRKHARLVMVMENFPTMQDLLERAVREYCARHDIEVLGERVTSAPEEG